MAELSFTETRRLEKLLDMGSGYVLDFSNRTFADFVVDSTGRNIYDERYHIGSGSKANRLRGFWQKEPNHVAGKLIGDLIEYSKDVRRGAETDQLRTDCSRIADRLKQGVAIEEIDALTPNHPDRSFEVLAKSIRDAIERNEPEAGLDRLHTFVMKFMRTLCEKRGIATPQEKPLHSLVGEYIKVIKDEGLIETEMTERILKSSISTMEAFNRVRNQQSLAHDNPLLAYEESLLIFNHVASSIRFIRALEERADAESQSLVVANEPVLEEVPF